MNPRWAVLITGSREWTDYGAIKAVLDEYPKIGLVVIHGDARGADSLAAHWCSVNKVTCVPMPAPWGELYRKAAGAVRNREMLQVLKALKVCGYCVRVEAFSLPQSKGTPDMKARSGAAGIETREHGTTGTVEHKWLGGP